MKRPEMLVGLGATKAGWSAELRGYLRDHLSGIGTEAVLDARQLARTGRRGFDVLLVDDMSRVFTHRDIAAAVHAGTVVIGLYDTERGLGRAHLERLGVSRLLPASVPTSELARVVTEIGPLNAGSEKSVDVRRFTDDDRPPRQGSLIAISAVSGGVGTSETLVALAETWARRSKVLVVEANPIAANLAARLNRDPAFGLGWTLGRIAQGHSALPEGLTPPRDGTGAQLGGFDVICQSTSPGGPPLMNSIQLMGLVEEARRIYDQVLVECGPLLAPVAGSGADRFAPGRAVLGAADRAVVFTSSDPEGAIRLLEWRAATIELGVVADPWAVFGRMPRRGGFEAAQLTGVVGRSTGEADFCGVWTLPEDPTVARARWNGELVRRGRWLGAVERLADAVVAVRTGPATESVVGSSRRMSLAGEVGW